MNTSMVSRDVERMSGALCLAGPRVLVQHMFDDLEGNASLNEFSADFPSVFGEVAIAVLEFRRASLLADAAAA